MIIHKVIATADIVFPISDFHKSRLLSYTRPDKLVPVTMGIDEQWLRINKGQIPHLAKLKLRHFLLVYFGAFGPIRKPQFLLEIFSSQLNIELYRFVLWERERPGLLKR